jgi:hypothetical protein
MKMEVGQKSVFKILCRSTSVWEYKDMSHNIPKRIPNLGIELPWMS